MCLCLESKSKALARECEMLLIPIQIGIVLAREGSPTGVFQLFQFSPPGHPDLEFPNFLP
jgi:hypothetical protein